MGKMKKSIYPFLLGAIFLGIIGFIAFAIKRTIEWVSIFLKIIIPTIDPSTINPAVLLILTLFIIFGVGIIIDKLLKKGLSSLMQQLLDKCPPVITEDGYLALKTGEKITPDGKIYATCVVPMIHFIPTILAGLFKIALKTNLKKLVIAPLDLLTLTMVAGLLELEKFEIEDFKEDNLKKD